MNYGSYLLCISTLYIIYYCTLTHSVFVRKKLKLYFSYVFLWIFTWWVEWCLVDIYACGHTVGCITDYWRPTFLPRHRTWYRLEIQDTILWVVLLISLDHICPIHLFNLYRDQKSEKIVLDPSRTADSFTLALAFKLEVSCVSWNESTICCPGHIVPSVWGVVLLRQ